MGTASMYGNQVMEAELDCPWMTTDVLIEFVHHLSLIHISEPTRPY